MSTLTAPRAPAEIDPAADLAAGRRPAGPQGGRRSRPGLAGLLLGGLLLLVLLSAFGHGAVTVAAGARVEVALCGLGILAAAGLLLDGRLRLPPSPAARAGLLAFAAFAAWSGLSVLWSAAPDSTWLETNRLLAYGLVLALGAILGASSRRAVEWTTNGLLAIVGLVTVYAIGQKLVPELRLGPLINFNQAGPVPRLQEPLGYWNALALFIALGALPAMFRVLDRSRSERARLLALAGASVMLVTIGLTLSRGGLLALVLALAIAMTLTRQGLRGAMWTGCVVAAAIPPLAVGLSLHALSGTSVGLSHRAVAGGVLAAVLAVSLSALVIGGRRLIELEGRTQLTEETLGLIRLGLRGLGAGLVLALIVGLALSSRGLTGEVSHAWHTFTANPSGSIYDPQHLLSEDSENRWVWWKEAAGAFSDRPWVGWGGGSFPVVHLLYRRDLLTVNQPHDLPLQFLSENGLVGTLIVVGALVLMILAALRAVRDPGLRPPERLARLGLLAGFIAFIGQSLYDWTWDIPGLAIPALLLLGVVIGTAPGARSRREGHSAAPRAPGPGGIWPTPSSAFGGSPVGRTGRCVLLAAVTFALCILALSDALPSIAAGDANAALVDGEAAPARAQAEAALAAQLDPLSDAGLTVEATLAQRRGDLTGARAYLRAAVQREPTDAQAWLRLAGVELLLGNLGAATQSAQRAIALDPTGLVGVFSAYGISGLAGVLVTPPQDSATALAAPEAGSSAAAAATPRDVPLRPIVPGLTGAAGLGTRGAPTQTAGTVASRSPAPSPAPLARTPATPSRRPAGSGGTSTRRHVSGSGGGHTTTSSGSVGPGSYKGGGNTQTTPTPTDSSGSGTTTGSSTLPQPVTTPQGTSTIPPPSGTTTGGH